MKINVKPKSKITHEGAKAYTVNAELQLRRSVMACMLWEDQFYEDGQTIADRIKSLIPLVKAEKAAEIAIEAREKMKLRHVPLLVVREMARLPGHSKLVAKTLERVIQRADELTEFLTIYWKDGKEKLSSQVKKGLAAAFPKFNAYNLAKYNRDGVVKLRDVLFLSHAKPKDEEQAKTWKKLIAGTLTPPDTWEVALSAGKDKKQTWEKMIKEEQLGPLALLRNLRNMQQVKVDDKVIIEGLEKMEVERILPFRFITAARYAPDFEPNLESAMLKCLKSQEKMMGKTILLIDVSGSMDDSISMKSELQRIDAACGLAILLREIAEFVSIFTFSSGLVKIAPRRGFALRDAIVNSQPHASTQMGAAVRYLNDTEEYDRIIVITDEQTEDSVNPPKRKGTMINVASNQNGVGYGVWNHIDGWSESVIDYIRTSEAQREKP